MERTLETNRSAHSTPPPSSFRQLSAAGNPEKPRGPGNGFRKRSEHCEMEDFAAFVGFHSFRQPSVPWKWLPEKERTLRNGRFCCFCGVRRPEIQKSQGCLEMASGKKRTLRNGRQLLAARHPENLGALPWKWLPEKERKLDDFAAFVGFPSFRPSAAGRGQKEARRGSEKARKRPGRGQKRFWKRPGRGQKEARRGQEEARKRPGRGQKRPGRGRKRPGRGQKEARRGQEEARGRGQKSPGRGQEEPRKRPEEARKRPEKARKRPAPGGGGPEEARKRLRWGP